MGGRSRRKGVRGELEAAAALRAIGIQARRGCQYSGTPDSPDLTNDRGIHWEVKRCEALSLYAAMAQAGEDAKHKIPAVLHRRNAPNNEWLVIVRLRDLKSFAAAVLMP